MIRQAAVLLAIPLLLVGLVATPLSFWRGSYQWLCAGVAVGLIVPVGLVTLLITDRLSKTSPYGRVAGLFLGTFVRLVVGFGGAAIVFLLTRPTFQADPVSFWLWVLGTYLVTLVVETILLAGTPPAR